MDIGIGLPSTIPGIPGRLILDWARAAEQAGFSSLGTLDRIVYANLETVPALAAVAAVTERIGLTTAILIGPYRGNGALLPRHTPGPTSPTTTASPATTPNASPLVPSPHHSRSPTPCPPSPTQAATN
jgi:hypothetical protein